MSGILALDQATTTGWAWCEPGGDPLWGHQRMGLRGAWEGVVFNEFRLFLLKRIDELEPEVVVFEAPFVPRDDRSEEASPFNANFNRRGYGLVAYITGICEERDLDCEEVQSPECAKFFTGRGRFPGKTTAARRAAKKRATMDACAARGWTVEPDEADALAILMFAEHLRYPKISRTRLMTLRQPRGPLFERLVAI